MLGEDVPFLQNFKRKSLLLFSACVTQRWRVGFHSDGAQFKHHKETEEPCERQPRAARERGPVPLNAPGARFVRFGGRALAGGRAAGRCSAQERARGRGARGGRGARIRARTAGERAAGM